MDAGQVVQPQLDVAQVARESLDGAAERAAGDDGGPADLEHEVVALRARRRGDPVDGERDGVLARDQRGAADEDVDHAVVPEPGGGAGERGQLVEGEVAGVEQVVGLQAGPESLGDVPVELGDRRRQAVDLAGLLLGTGRRVDPDLRHLLGGGVEVGRDPGRRAESGLAHGRLAGVVGERVERLPQQAHRLGQARAVRPEDALRPLQHGRPRVRAAGRGRLAPYGEVVDVAAQALEADDVDAVAPHAAAAHPGRAQVRRRRDDLHPLAGVALHAGGGDVVGGGLDSALCRSERAGADAEGREGHVCSYRVVRRRGSGADHDVVRPGP